MEGGLVPALKALSGPATRAPRHSHDPALAIRRLPGPVLRDIEGTAALDELRAPAAQNRR
jgi:hypothetical protein